MLAGAFFVCQDFPRLTKFPITTYDMEMATDLRA